jgi:hypothetical protein
VGIWYAIPTIYILYINMHYGVCVSCLGVCTFGVFYTVRWFDVDKLVTGCLVYCVHGRESRRLTRVVLVVKRRTLERSGMFWVTVGLKLKRKQDDSDQGRI